MSHIAKRLLPGQDLRLELQKLADEHAIQAGVVVSGVGSLTRARLRNAGASAVLDLNGPLEIVSITGTLSIAGMHIHLSVADAAGATKGGHLLDGCVIASTAEIVIAIIEGLRFSREVDATTQYKELCIHES